MKKLLLCILALLSAQAFGQAYPGTVLQNSSGNYSRAVPYPQVLVCVANDGNVPCITRATTYSDSTLGTQCTQTGSSGLLIGNPTSGANCNNPGIGDTNGNFQLYLANGQYTLCTFSGTWLCQQFTMGGSGSSGIACGSSHSVVYSAALNSFACDPFFTDDGAGHPTARSLGLTDPTYSGFFYLTQGPAPPLQAANSIYFYAPISVTSYAWVLPAAAGSGCMQASNAAGLVTISFTGTNCGTGSGGIEAQTNGTDNANCVSHSCPLVNAVSTPSITASNPSGGIWQFSTAGAGQLANPSTPTVTPQGTTGSTTYSYLVIGVQNGTGAANATTVSSVGTTTTGNAALSSSGCPGACTAANLLSGYGDTLYGVRGFIVCRTAGGATQGVITGTASVPLLAGKKFIDTGLSADGTNCATKYATNTTVTQPVCLGSSLPGTPTTPGFPCGFDGPPLSPNALDDEFGRTFGAPGDVNDGTLVWHNQNGATASWSNGALVMQSDTGASPSLEALLSTNALPSTPFTFNTFQDTQGSTNPSFGGLYLRESSTGKVAYCTILNQVGSGGMSLYLIYGTDTALTSTISISFYGAGDGYVWTQDDGTNINCYFSATGDGISKFKYASVAVTTAFTTAPNQYGFYVNRNTTLGTLGMEDWVRRTQ